MLQIKERARKYRNKPLTNLHQYIDEEMLKDSFMGFNKHICAGVDKKYWHNFSYRLQFSFSQLVG
ncbi:MAG: hypothetical protein OEX02_18575 [Cyclobacteriaceae bacterium]|nr:hypothetical protein [Cyclobacteriaceae bacterium]